MTNPEWTPEEEEAFRELERAPVDHCGTLAGVQPPANRWAGMSDDQMWNDIVSTWIPGETVKVPPVVRAKLLPPALRAAEVRARMLDHLDGRGDN